MLGVARRCRMIPDESRSEYKCELEHTLFNNFCWYFTPCVHISLWINLLVARRYDEKNSTARFWRYQRLRGEWWVAIASFSSNLGSSSFICNGGIFTVLLFYLVDSHRYLSETRRRRLNRRQLSLGITISAFSHVKFTLLRLKIVNWFRHLPYSGLILLS